MSANTELKILKPVVAGIAVPVVDGFVLMEIPPEMLCHDVSVFENVLPVDAELDVAVALADMPATLPVRVF
jgi:hypothetical protein